MEMKDSTIQEYVKKGRLIYTHKFTQDMTQIFNLYVPVVTSVWLIGVMKNIIFG